MQLQFVLPEVFVGKDTGKPLDLGEDEEIRMILPRQFPDVALF